MAPREQIAANAETYKQQVFKILDPVATEVRFNSEWLSPLGAEGMIKLAAKYTPASGKIWLSAEREDALVVIRVRDSGMGITPELRTRIFDLFTQGVRTLDRAEGGLGIGLTVVRRMVELHGGDVTARSDGPGLGSTFTVRLPHIAAARPGNVR